MRQSISAVLCGVTLVWVVGVGPLCWVLRDGLGPDATDSSGWAAAGRFLLTFYWGPVALVLAACCLLEVRSRAGRSEQLADAEPGAAADGGG